MPDLKDVLASLQERSVQSLMYIDPGNMHKNNLLRDRLHTIHDHR